jgi:rhamnulokinase
MAIFRGGCMTAQHYVAFDLGASGGRAILGAFDGKQLQIEEIHRFPNGMIRLLGHLHWDVLQLFEEMKHALALCAKRPEVTLESIGVDTWGVDFALIGKYRTLLGLPYAYRDPHVEGMMEAVFEIVPREEIFRQTGIQFLPINSLYHLVALTRAHSPLLDVAEHFLMIPDLFNLFLTGEAVVEFTDATTTQCYDPRRGDWAWPLLEQLGIRTRIFSEIVPPGTVIGPLLPDIVEETGIGGVTVVAPASHDTGSAVAAVPATGDDWAYTSLGTWSLMGIEVPEPIITDRALSCNFTNEGGVCETFRFLKNITGLWLIQECRRVWAREGEDVTYQTIVQMAKGAAPHTACIDPDDPTFLNPMNMSEAIRRFCERTGQPSPSSQGEIARVIFESLALKHRYVLDMLREFRPKPFSTLHIVGGGTQNTLLCQFIANATGLRVVAGPVEATAIGNLLVQVMAKVEIDSLSDLRHVVRQSFPLVTYEPEETTSWEEAYGRFRRILLE